MQWKFFVLLKHSSLPTNGYSSYHVAENNPIDEVSSQSHNIRVCIKVLSLPVLLPFRYTSHTNLPCILCKVCAFRKVVSHNWT